MEEMNLFQEKKKEGCCFVCLFTHVITVMFITHFLFIYFFDKLYKQANRQNRFFYIAQTK